MLSAGFKQQLRTLDVELTNMSNRKDFEEGQVQDLEECLNKLNKLEQQKISIRDQISMNHKLQDIRSQENPKEQSLKRAKEIEKQLPDQLIKQYEGP